MYPSRVGSNVKVGCHITLCATVQRSGIFVNIWKTLDSGRQRHMFITTEAWIKFCADITELDLKGKTGQERGITLATPRWLKTAKDWNSGAGGYVRIHSSGQNVSEDEIYICFSASDVIELREGKAAAITSRTERTPVYSRYCGRRWHLLEEATDEGQVIESPPFPLHLNLVQIPPPRVLTLRLTTFIMAGEIEKLKKSTCYGCEHDSPGQRDHMEGGCLSTWGEAVYAHAPTVYKTLNITSCIDKVNAKMNWSLEVLQFNETEITTALLQMNERKYRHDICVDGRIICIARVIDTFWKDLEIEGGSPLW